MVSKEDIRSISKEKVDLELKLKLLQEKLDKINPTTPTTNLSSKNSDDSFNEKLNFLLNDLKTHTYTLNKSTEINSFNGVFTLNGIKDAKNLSKIYYDYLTKSNINMVLVDNLSTDNYNITLYTNIPKNNSSSSNFSISHILNQFLMYNINYIPLDSKNYDFNLEVSTEDLHKLNLINNKFGDVHLFQNSRVSSIFKISDVYEFGYLNKNDIKNLFDIDDNYEKILPLLNDLESKQLSYNNKLPFELLTKFYNQKDLVALKTPVEEFISEEKAHSNKIFYFEDISVVAKENLKPSLTSDLFKEYSKFLIDIYESFGFESIRPVDLESINNYLITNVGYKVEKISSDVYSNMMSTLGLMLKKKFKQRFNKESKKNKSIMVDVNFNDFNKYVDSEIELKLKQLKDEFGGIPVNVFRDIVNSTTYSIKNGFKVNLTNSTRKFKSVKKTNRKRKSSPKKKNVFSESGLNFYASTNNIYSKNDISILDLYKIIKINKIPFKSIGPDLVLFSLDNVTKLESLIKTYNLKDIVSNKNSLSLKDPALSSEDLELKELESTIKKEENLDDLLTLTYKQLSKDLKKSYGGVKRIILKNIKNSIIAKEQFYNLIKNYDLTKSIVTKIFDDEKKINIIIEDINNNSIPDLKKIYLTNINSDSIYNNLNLSNNRLFHNNNKSKTYLNELITHNKLTITQNEHWSKSNTSGLRGAAIISRIEKDIKQIYNFFNKNEQYNITITNDYLSIEIDTDTKNLLKDILEYKNI